MSQPTGPEITTEAPEIRDADEQHEDKTRMSIAAGGWPCDANGRPMMIVTGSCSDKVPTVQYGNVVIGPATAQLPIAIPEGATDEEIQQLMVDGLRSVQRMAEYVVGTERRALQWALNPEMRIARPSGLTFGGLEPPAGYVDPDPQSTAEGLGAAAVIAENHQAAPTAEVPAPQQPSAAQVTPG